MKKEELQKELGKLERRNQDLVNDDQRIREEFAKSFRWGSPKKDVYGNPYNRFSKEEWEWKIPTWEQIFVEVGKLKSLMDYRDFEGNISELGTAIEKIEQKLCDKCKDDFNCGKHYRNY